MKKLVGGDYLLDLTPIELEESEDVETYTNITNKEIIEQLTNLKKFVPNPSMVKPVWVKLKNGETDEIVVVRGEFKVVDAGEFEIVVAIDGYKLKIHIEFTQALNENNDPIDDWYIAENDAKYLFTSDAQNLVEIANDSDLTKEWNGNFATPEGLTKVSQFVKVIRNFKELQFICNCRVSNNTESTITIANDSLLVLFDELPLEIRDKIYLHSGNKCSGDYDGSIAYATCYISLIAGQVDGSNNPKYVNLYYDHNTKTFRFYVEGGNIAIGSTVILDIEARISLAL